MKTRGNIVFLGMMGSGKTTIGKLVSKRLKLDFIDVDDFIVKKFGMKITKIFSSKGEKFFRKIEEKITLDILKKETVTKSDKVSIATKDRPATIAGRAEGRIIFKKVFFEDNPRFFPTSIRFCDW